MPRNLTGQCSIFIDFGGKTGRCLIFIDFGGNLTAHVLFP